LHLITFLRNEFIALMAITVDALVRCQSTAHLGRFYLLHVPEGII
jgi:hypothetical protein